jgi:hypothetical protein
MSRKLGGSKLTKPYNRQWLTKNPVELLCRLFKCTAFGVAPQIEQANFGLLPFLEALIGISLILGLLTKWALLAGSLLMSILSFGTCCARIGQTVGVQMILSVFL